MKNTTCRRFVPLLAGVLLVPTLLTGCSAEPDPSGTPSAGRDTDLKISQCMRDKGHDMADDSGVAMNADTASDASFMTDLADCQEQHGAGGAAAGGAGTTIDTEKEVELARCMREHGVVDYPDPDPGELKPYEGAYEEAFDSAAPVCDKEVYGYDGGSGTTGVQP